MSKFHRAELTGSEKPKISLEQTNVLIKFHDNVLTRINCLPQAAMQIATPPGGHVFNEDRTIIVDSSVLTRKNATATDGHFNEDRTVNVAARPYEDISETMNTNGLFFQATVIIFKLVQDIIGKNILTKFHGDRTINVASRVKTGPDRILTILHKRS
ncbi:hypothetical protein DPMN_028135 [Dreissena polymorpha]|uniref:Uncharacterized protein n=1 Tax=Dreissena polymorpha TaxID=45954 RepID=A0A9D4RE36_DREPO|nr:hypothetical protein DPMN_028135 [Dreissena polymorpha]